MLPFLKNRDDGVGVGPTETVERKPDEGGDYDMLDAVVDDLMEALHKKDKGLLKSAIEALVDHIQNQDAVQDETMAEEIV